LKHDLTPKELKSILHSKRANIYYLEHCRVLVNGGRVEYVTEQGRDSLYWNIPIANTTTLLLGTGTSVTQAAVRELAKAGLNAEHSHGLRTVCMCLRVQDSMGTIAR
jgi:CRISP-associated protein Cas1